MASLSCLRGHVSRTLRTSKGFSTIAFPRVDTGPAERWAFNRSTFDGSKPLVLSPELFRAPAMTTWFSSSDGQASTAFTQRVTQFRDHIFPYEQVINATDQSAEVYPVPTSAGPWRQTEIQFNRYDAPLDHLLSALTHNGQAPPAQRIKQLYIAQSSLDDLPKPLQDDLLIPEIIHTVMGRGDIYGSSVWLGLEPTYTPLHRDPNPNLFHQMVSRKIVRLMEPAEGQNLFNAVQAQLGQSGSSRFRGEEMMEGPERAALFDAIWSDNVPGNIQEASLGPGESLYIPKGWWHSVRSAFDDGRLNASANWWFR